MNNKDSTDKIRRQIKNLNKKFQGRSNRTTASGYPRIYYKVNVHWSAIEEVLLKQMMKQEHEYSRAALVRRCIHERAMRTLGEEYYEILEEPSKFIK